MQENFKAFSNPTQLLGMIEIGAANSMLIALPPEPGLVRAFQARSEQIELWHHDYALARLEYNQADAFSLLPPPGPFELVLYYLPKARNYQAYTLDLLRSSLSKHSRIIAVGPKRGGAGSSLELLSTHFKVGEKHSARHCVAWDCSATPEKIKTQPSLIFEASAWGRQAQIHSLPGIFNHGSLDEGTRLLMNTIKLKDYKFKSALDWGCGSGVIGTLIKLAKNDCEVTLADVNAMALQSCRLTLKENALQANVVASDGFSDLPDKYDLIVTNPPAHKGLATDLSMTEKFLNEAPAHLNPGGRLVFVANSHLPYLKILNKTYRRLILLAKTPQFQVIEAKV